RAVGRTQNAHGRAAGQAQQRRHCRGSDACVESHRAGQSRQCDDALGFRMTDVWLDIRHAWRRLASNPAHTAIMFVTLALAIGSTTAVFTVVDEPLLRLD